MNVQCVCSNIESKIRRNSSNASKTNKCFVDLQWECEKGERILFINCEQPTESKHLSKNHFYRIIDYKMSNRV